MMPHTTDPATQVPTGSVARVVPASRRTLCAWVGVGCLVVWLVVSQRGELGAAAVAVAGGSPVWLGVAAVLCLLSLVNLAGLQSQTQGMLDVRRPIGRTMRLTAGAHALDLATKSGGVAGALRFATDARRHGQSAPCAGAGCLLAELFTHLGFTSMLALVVPLAWGRGQLSGTDVGGVTVYVAVTVGLVALAVAAVRSDRSIDRLAGAAGRVRRRLTRRRRADLGTRGSTLAVEELRLAIGAARGNARALRRAGVHALAWPSLGALLLAAACAAVGVHLAPLAVLVTYCLTTTFAIVGFLPGGIGFAEVSMGATLHSLGVDAGHTVAAVAVYRMFDLWLPLVLGAVALRVGRTGSVRDDMAIGGR